MASRGAAPKELLSEFLGVNLTPLQRTVLWRMAEKIGERPSDCARGLIEIGLMQAGEMKPDEINTGWVLKLAAKRGKDWYKRSARILRSLELESGSR